jgi:hypothetical protein
MKSLPAAVLFVLATAGCARESWVTPLAAPRPGRVAACSIAVEKVPQPGTEPLAIVHCSDGLYGRDCWTQLREQACAAGGDVIFGAHYESTDLVATVGTVGAERKP